MSLPGRAATPGDGRAAYNVSFGGHALAADLLRRPRLDKRISPHLRIPRIAHCISNIIHFSFNNNKNIAKRETMAM